MVNSIFFYVALAGGTFKRCIMIGYFIKLLDQLHLFLTFQIVNNVVTTTCKQFRPHAQYDVEFKCHVVAQIAPAHLQ